MILFLRLFYEFFMAGLFAVGGGLATLPFLYSMSTKTGWFTFGDLADMVAISQSTPGPLGVNMASYVGFHTSGLLGSTIATIGLVFPSVVIIILISKILNKFKNSEYVKGAFYGLRPASTALIGAALFGVVKISLFNIDLYNKTQNLMDFFQYKSIILALILFFIIRKSKIHPIAFIAISGVIGVIFQFAA